MIYIFSTHHHAIIDYLDRNWRSVARNSVEISGISLTRDAYQGFRRPSKNRPLRKSKCYVLTLF